MKISQTTWLNSFLIATALTLASCGGGSGGGDDDGSGPSQRSVGKKLFFDEDLSSNGNQSCGSCHDPAAGFADPVVTAAAPVSVGSDTISFGNRNAPTAAYAAFIPPFIPLVTQTDNDNTTSNFQGGQFLDGRRDTLEEQAKDPFLNSVEMNMTKTAVVDAVENSSYANEFKEVFGANAFDNEDHAYDNIATAIAAFESSSEVNPFTSKFDAFMAGNPIFNASEQRGFDLFTGTVAKCANCHTVNSPDASGSLFTNFNYYNIGTPANPNNPANPFTDGGLGDRAGIPASEMGKFRTPTLRNIELTAPYMHNGVYADLTAVIRHYDIQIADANITPEVGTNIANELGEGGFPLGLSGQDYTDLENFMLTLTDGYF